MPSSRPCAAFEPISPDFDVKTLVAQNPNFEWVVRINVDMLDYHGLENFEKLVLFHVILGGLPLVIDGYQERLDQWTFSLQWLKDNCSTKVENARDLTKKANVPLTIGHYLNHMALLTNQWTEKNYKDPDRQRMYLKDIDCPQTWADKLQDVIPYGLFYLNESTGDVDGLGAVEGPDSNGTGTRKGRGIAKAGDLMSSLPKEMRAENMMCYIGHEGTYTPAHREMCASLGQNIMVEASTGRIEDGEPTKPGSSIWFMTETKEKDVVSEYWLSRLGHDIEVENHFAQINAWKAAPFKVYVVEQRVGDLILIPPLAPHQVWNRGTRTMKVAWNRTTVETLEMALHEALPRARMVCRDEQYKNKAIIYYTMMKYSELLKAGEKVLQKSSAKHRNPSDQKIRQLQKDFRRLQALFTEIMISESFYPNQSEKMVEYLAFDSYVTCSYCRCNIFNRFLTCPSCVGDLGGGEKDTYDICLDCYSMGRSCLCISKLKWVEQFRWGELVQKHEQWRHQILRYEGQVNEKSPKSLRTELDRLGNKRTLAQICQTELTRRPFNDIQKPKTPVTGVRVEEEIELDINGNVKKTRKIRRSEKFVREHGRCHIDCHWEPKWKQVQCSKCDKNYCYGILFRGYDLMPQDIMADLDWQCPSCRNMCNCRHCRCKPGFKPYHPSGTILGHNTKLVADPRSVESLVDFSYSNITWIQKAGDDHKDDTARLKRRKVAAEKAQAKKIDFGDHYAEEQDGNNVEEKLLSLARQKEIPIDPALGLMDAYDVANDGSEDEYDENPEEARNSRDLLTDNPSAPQFIVPDGGVVRDSEHFYTPTEAITYDYPDPEMGLSARTPAEDEAQGQAIPAGCALAITPETAKIQMINRKRKRQSKVDSGERGHKNLGPKKPTQRRSLLLKLGIDKAKLAEINKRATVDKQALSGFNGEPAILSSDLRALNAARHVVEGEQPQNKAWTDQVILETDDEFTPRRYRDRRKAVVDGESSLTPDSDINTRKTRMQPITYEDPSDDDDFNETVRPRPRDQMRTRLATMAEPVHPSKPVVTKAVMLNSDEEEDGTSPNKSSYVHFEGDEISDLPEPETARRRNHPQMYNDINASLKAISQSNVAAVNINGGLQARAKRSLLSQAVAARTVSAKAAEQAEASRKAKLATIAGLDDDSEAWSSDDTEPSPGRAPAVKPPITKHSHQSLSNTSRPSLSRIDQNPKAQSLQKVSAADWGDSDSSENEVPPRRKPTFRSASQQVSHRWL